MKVVFILFLFGFPLVLTTGTNRDVGIFNLNSEVDELLTNLNQIISLTGLDVLPLSDFTETFKAKWKLVKATCHFTATNGKVRSLATLQRTGNATLSASPSSVTLDLRLGLGQIQADYKYKVKFHLFSVSGKLGARVRKLSLRVQVTLYVDEHDDTCQAVLDLVSVEVLDDIDVTVSGLGALNWTMEKILEFITKHLQTDMRTRLEGALSSALENQLKKRAICDLLYDI